MAYGFITICSILLLLFYVTLIIAYYLAWKRIPYFRYIEPTTNHTFSVLVSMRNEEKTALNCLSSIVNQNYPPNSFEVIVIDDHSTDQTVSVVNRFILAHPQYRIKLLHMSDDSLKRSKKKAAITFGITQASGQFIILTDADCVRGTRWLEAINSFICKTQAKFVYAPVLFKATTLFEKIQSLEFAGLVAIGGAAIEIKNPNMCSASNLIFEKELFVAIDGYSGSENITTGDDEYLLHKAFKKYPEHIHFLKNREAIVTTSANSSMTELINQRKRWVSSSTKYENRYITAILIAAYLFNGSILILLILNPFVGLLVLTIKALTEGLFLYDVLSFFKRKNYILLLPLAEPFHILYVLFIGLWANMGSYTWKERTVS